MMQPAVRVSHARPVVAALLSLAACVPAVPGVAQSPAPRPEPVRAEVFVGSEAERYLRVLQLAGHAPVYPWSVRGLGQRDLDRAAPADSAAHPWAAAMDFRRAPGVRVSLVGPGAAARFNSGFPYGGNDGPVWAGRGLTAQATAGVALEAGPVTLVLAPTVFVAQNQDFELAPNGRPADERFMNPSAPYQIDLPQRFGDDAYRRVDPGESTLRVDAGPVSLGASTASQQWGPGIEQPLLLGNNAGGYPHLFVGTSRAVNVGVGRLQTRLVWGTLAQSGWARDSAEPRRFASGWVVAFSPRPWPNLELGAGRFFHTPWPEDGLDFDNFLKPFDGLLKTQLDSTDYPDLRGDRDNQLISVFGRWVLPRAGFEVYGEYLRDDHNWDLQDALMEPDQMSAYTLGFQKLWHRGDGGMLVLRGEVMNARRSTLLNVRTQNLTYMHFATPQGHTLRGQVLGAPDAFGGAGSTVALDRYLRSGRWTVRWDRAERGERLASDSVQPVLDVTHALGAERVLFVRGAELSGSLRAVWEMNRGFGGDAFNLNAALGVRARF
ncbi:MAG TPA: capsule assembly Wzi family protein [Longimicrobium sp.]|nr:capsule assembly Wzi family protein [Longimicrobium sp.]